MTKNTSSRYRRDFTAHEWSLLRQGARDGKSLSVVTKEVFKGEFGDDCVRKRTRVYGIQFSRRSAHLGNTKLSLGGKQGEEQYVKESSVHARSADR